MEDEEVAAAAAVQMESVQQAFATAKRAGIPAAMRLMKELRRVCVGGTFEVDLVDSAPQPLQQWAVRLYEWNFADDSQLADDLGEMSTDEEPTPLCLSMKFPDDFPFAPPLVFVSSPQLHSGHVLDGALCMEMLVEWQPSYGNVEAMLVQICAFLSVNSRVSALADQSAGPSSAPVDQEAAQRAYARLQSIHDRKGWGRVDAKS